MPDIFAEISDIQEYIDISEKAHEDLKTTRLSIASPLVMALRKEQVVLKQEEEKVTKIKQRLMQLMRQGNYELVARIVRQVKGSESFDDIQGYVDDPATFYKDVQQVVTSQGLDVGQYTESYKKFLRSFLTHFRTSMEDWEQWQVEIFMFEIEIISVFLSYRTVDGSITEDEVITQLIENLNPYDPDISKSDVFLKGAFIKDVATLGIIGMLALVAAAYMSKKGAK